MERDKMLGASKVFYMMLLLDMLMNTFLGTHS